MAGSAAFPILEVSNGLAKRNVDARVHSQCSNARPLLFREEQSFRSPVILSKFHSKLLPYRVLGTL